MQLNLSGGLASVMAALFPGVNATSVGVTGPLASEFERILTRLSAVFENPGQGQFHSAAPQVPPDTRGLGGMGNVVAEEAGRLLENLKALRAHLEAALQSVRAEETEVQQLPLDTRVQGEMGNVVAEEAGRFLENLKALRAHLEAMLSTRTAAGQNLPAGEEEKNAALRLAEAVSQLSQLYQPDSKASGAVESPKIDEVSTVEERSPPVSPEIHAIAAQLIEDVRAIIAAVDARLSSSWSDSGFNQDTQVLLSSMDRKPKPAPSLLGFAFDQDTPAPVAATGQKPEPTPLVVSQFKDLAAEAEVPKPAETGILVKSGSTPEAAFSGGLPRPDPQVSEVGPDSTGHGIELTLGKVAGFAPGPTPVPQHGDRAWLELKQPLGHPEWADELGQRLIWMHGKSIQAAEIHLNPPQLGPVAVRIQVHDDQTSIQFASPHAAVREAIEAALPRLRELFEARQLPLTQVEVTQQSLEDRSHSQRREQSHALIQDYQVNAREEGLEESGRDSGQLKVNISSHLLSLYA